uniref:Immunoglobulin V-set domain-containing protein n=1 Tax=Naja naja TaxID=35670 RepID=A0A8C6X3L9_NAJNA
MPLTSTISGMKMQEVIKIQGESLIVKAFCSQQHVQAEIVWCKEELPKECSLEKLISFSRSRWKRLTTQPDQRVIMNDLGNGCIYVFMSALQSEDTGIYWFGVLDGPNIIPLRKIRVIVQKGNLPLTCFN